MRITEGMRYGQVQQNLARLSEQHADAVRQASTGQRVEKPSDDPVAAAELARLRASQNRTTSHLETIRATRGDAELTESTLASAGDLLVRLQEIATQGANGSLTAEDRKNLGVEAKNLKEELVKLSNTRGTKGYLFAGSLTDSPAFSATGTYLGDSAEQVVTIGNSTPTAVNVTGTSSFVVAGGRDVFADIDSLITGLASNDQNAVQGALPSLEQSRKQLTDARGRAGLVMSRLDASESILSSLDTEQQSRAQAVGGADPVEAYTRLNQLSGSLERAISVSRQILDLSNLNRF